MKKNVLAGIAALILVTLVLAACSAPETPAAPTADANAVYTQAAGTVAAGLTQTAEKNPTATPLPPTNTPTMIASSATPTQNGAAAASPTTDAAQPTATLAAAASTPVPTATKAAGAPAPAAPDKAEWVSQSPADNTNVPKNATFTMTFVLKNTGTTTWTKNYMFRYYAGDRMDSPKDLNLTQEVKPNDSIEITFTLIAPSEKKTTNSVWVLSNADGQNFYSVFLKLEITD